MQKKNNHILYLTSLDYSKNNNSFWRLKIFKKFNQYFNITNSNRI